MAAIVGAVGFMVASPTQAAILYWDGASASNNWSTLANWGTTGANNTTDPAAIPTAGDEVVYYSTGGARLLTGTLSTTPFTINSLTFGNGQTGAVTIAGTAGSGILTLSGTSNYNPSTYNSGASTNLGTVGVYIQSGFGAVTLSAPTVLGNSQKWINNSASTFTKTGTLDLGSNTLTVDGTGNTSISAVISGLGGLTKSGSGTLTLTTGANTFAGDITINEGTLRLSSTVSISTGSNVVGVASGAVFEHLDTVIAGLIDLSGAGGTVRTNTTSRTLTIAGTGSYSFSGTITNNAALTTALVKTGSGTQTLTGNNTFTGGINVNNGKLILDYANASTGTSTNYAVASNALTMGGGTIEFLGKTGGGNTTNQSLGNVTTSTSTGYSSIIVNANSGAATTLTAGTVTLNASTLLFLDQSSGGVFKTTSTTGSGNGLVTAAGGRFLVKDSTGRIDFATNSGGSTPITALTATTDFPLTAGTSTINYRLNGGSAGTQTGNTTVNSLRINVTGSGQSLAMGTTSLQITSAGLLIVGSNDYSITGSGTSNIANASGTVFLEHFGTGTLTITTKLGNGNGNAVFYGNGSNLIDWNSASNILATSGNLNGSGVNFISNVTVRLSNSSALDLTNTSTLVNGTGIITVNGNGIIELATGDLTRNTGTTGPGQINMNGNGGFSAYGADRVVNFGNGAQTWGTTAGFVGNGATLILGSGFSTNTLDLQNAINLGALNRVVEVRNGTSSTNVDGKLSGVLSGAGGLVKTGAGTLVLSGTNTYTGATNANAGKLLINGNQSAATGAVNVANTATLGGSGTIGGAVAINSGGTLSPGNSVGTLTINNALNLNSGSFSNFEITGNAASNTYDKIVVSGALVYGGTLNVSYLTTNPSAAGVYTLFSGFSGQSGDFSTVSLPTAPGGFAWKDFGSSDYFDNATGSIELIASGGATNGQYSLTASTGSTGVLKGGNTSLSSTILNTGTGSQDSINFTSLSASSAANGSIAGSATNGGPLAQAASGNNTGLTFTGTGYSSGVTVTPTVGGVTNVSAGGTPSNSGTTTVSIVVGNATAQASAASGRANPTSLFTPANALTAASGSTVVGLASKVVSGGSLGAFQTEAQILGSSNTLAAGTITENWRARATDEQTAGSPINGGGQYRLASDVVDLTGLSGTFALQMNYDDTGLANEASAAANGFIFLGYLYDNGTPVNFADDVWVNSILGNTATGGSAQANVLTDYATFVTANSINAGNIANYLGSWGVDTGSNTVWAILDHNTQFAAVVPEPASLGLLALGGLALLGRRRRN